MTTDDKTGSTRLTLGSSTRRVLTREEVESISYSGNEIPSEPVRASSDFVRGDQLLSKSDKEKIQEIAAKNRFYLPVLHLNNPEMWESRPVSERVQFTSNVAMETCLSNCAGVPGLKSACCVMDLDDMEHVLGPVTEEDIKRILTAFRKKGFNFNRSDIVIDHEEGELLADAFFSGNPQRSAVFKDKNSYPIMRIQAFGPRFACKFLNTHNGKCNIYAHRPDMCRDYLCSYVKKNFLVSTKPQSNDYHRVDKSATRESDS